MMTNERLAELRALAEAATAGPWTCEDVPNACGIRTNQLIIVRGPHWDVVARCSGANPADATFIRATREAVPELLAEVERLRRLDKHAQHSAAMRGID